METKEELKKQLNYYTAITGWLSDKINDINRDCQYCIEELPTFVREEYLQLFDQWDVFQEKRQQLKKQILEISKTENR